jgi:hypothetical protein
VGGWLRNDLHRLASPSTRQRVGRPTLPLHGEWRMGRRRKERQANRLFMRVESAVVGPFPRDQRQISLRPAPLLRLVRRISWKQSAGQTRRQKEIRRPLRQLAVRPLRAASSYYGASYRHRAGLVSKLSRRDIVSRRFPVSDRVAFTADLETGSRAQRPLQVPSCNVIGSTWHPLPDLEPQIQLLPADHA